MTNTANKPLDWYAVALAGYQEAVDELRSRHGREQRHDQQRPVEVGGDDVRLFGEVRGPANEVVAVSYTHLTTGACGR